METPNADAPRLCSWFRACRRGGFIGGDFGSRNPLSGDAIANPASDRYTRKWRKGILDDWVQHARFSARNGGQELWLLCPVLGPALRLRCGETTEISFENKMDEPTTVHWHGVLIPGSVDGGSHNLIRLGQSWTVRPSIDQPGTTAWFHSHPHGATASQVYWGLAGLLLIEDASGERLGLLRNYGVDDLPLVTQDRIIERGGLPIYDPGLMDVMRAVGECKKRHRRIVAD